MVNSGRPVPTWANQRMPTPAEERLEQLRAERDTIVKRRNASPKLEGQRAPLEKLPTDDTFKFDSRLPEMPTQLTQPVPVAPASTPPASTPPATTPAPLPVKQD